MKRLYAQLERPAVISLFRIVGAAAGFLCQIMLAWILTPHQLGIFYSATSLAMVTGIIASQGYQQIAPRFTVRYQESGKRRLYSSFVGRTLSDSLRFATFAALVIFSGALLIHGVTDSDRWSYAICGAMVIPVTLLTICTNFAAALKHFGICYAPEGLFRPIAFLLLICGLVLLGVKLTNVEVTALFAALTSATAVYVYVAMRGRLPAWHVQPWRTDRLAKRWRREAWPLVLLALFTNYFSDIAIICATPFLSSANVAVFGLCLKLALLVGYVVQIGQQMAVPDLAVARHNGDAAAIESILRRSMTVPVVATAGATIVIAVFGKLLLTMFGQSFAIGYTALLLLVLSQFIRAIAGPNSHLVTLAGAQRLNAALCAAAMAVLLLSNLIIVPQFGLVGAALAVLATYGLWVIAVASALQGIGEFRTDIFAVFTARPERISQARSASMN